MEIVKAFSENNLHTEIVIKGTHKDPLFRASDIGLILELTNIHKSIKDFNETQKVITESSTLGGNQKMVFLTAKGLYKLLCISRKPIAEKFQDWVFQVIEDIRLTGEYKLNKENQELKNEITQKNNIIFDLEEEVENVENEIIQKNNFIVELQEEVKNVENEIIQVKVQAEEFIYNAKEQMFIQQFPENKQCIYLGTIGNTNEKGEKLAKLGETNNFKNRLYQNKSVFDDFKIEYVYEVTNSMEVEKLILNYLKFEKHRRSLFVKEHNRTELIAYSEKYFTLSIIDYNIKQIIKSSVDINKLLVENNQLKATNGELKDEIKDYKSKYEQEFIKNRYNEEIVEKQKQRIEFLESEEKYETENPLLPKDELHEKFDKFIKERCIVRPDVKIDSSDIIAYYRIWANVKPTKETNSAFRNYLDIKFKPSKDSNKIYIGVMVRPYEYTKILTNSDIEIFVFNVCQFGPNQRILDYDLNEAYKKWKKSVNRPFEESELNDLKKYLSESEYFTRGSIHIPGRVIDANSQNRGNYGYWGLCLKTDIPYKHMVNTSTGKAVIKRMISTNEEIGSWESVKAAAKEATVNTATMSRYVNKKIKFVKENYYYEFKEKI